MTDLSKDDPAAPRLCQELIDLIIENLDGQRDEKTLKCCSIVSHSFCTPSQRKLFHTISFKETLRYRQCSAAFMFELALEHTENFTRLAAYVKVLRLYDQHDDYRGRMDWWEPSRNCDFEPGSKDAQWITTDRSLSKILPHLPNLESIQLAGDYFDFGDFLEEEPGNRLLMRKASGDTRAALNSAMRSPKIRSLVFRHIEFDGTELFDMIRHFPSGLKHLELRGISNYAAHSTHKKVKKILSHLEWPSNIDPICLETLVYLAEPSTVASCLFTLPIFDWRCLRKLTVVLDVYIQVDDVSRITHSSPVLEELSVFATTEYLYMGKGMSSAELINTSNLRTLHFNLIIDGCGHRVNDLLDWWCDSYEMSSPHRKLREVSIDIFSHLDTLKHFDYSDGDGWDRLDDLFYDEGRKDLRLKLAVNFAAIPLELDPDEEDPVWAIENMRYCNAPPSMLEELAEAFPLMLSDDAATVEQRNWRIENYLGVGRER